MKRLIPTFLILCLLSVTASARSSCVLSDPRSVELDGVFSQGEYPQAVTLLAEEGLYAAQIGASSECLNAEQLYSAMGLLPQEVRARYGVAAGEMGLFLCLDLLAPSAHLSPMTHPVFGKVYSVAVTVSLEESGAYWRGVYFFNENLSLIALEGTSYSLVNGVGRFSSRMLWRFGEETQWEGEELTEEAVLREGAYLRLRQGEGTACFECFVPITFLLSPYSQSQRETLGAALSDATLSEGRVLVLLGFFDPWEGGSSYPVLSTARPLDRIEENGLSLRDTLGEIDGEYHGFLSSKLTFTPALQQGSTASGGQAPLTTPEGETGSGQFLPPLDMETGEWEDETIHTGNKEEEKEEEPIWALNLLLILSGILLASIALFFYFFIRRNERKEEELRRISLQKEQEKEKRRRGTKKQ